MKGVNEMQISVRSETGERLKEIEERLNNLIELYYLRETEKGLEGMIGWGITYGETRLLQELRIYAKQEARKIVAI